MKAPKNSRSVALVMLGALMSIGVVAFALQASGAVPAKPGITVQISPASQSITRGSPASYTVSLTSTGGFAGSVALSATGLPSGSAASFAPTSQPLTSGSTATSVLSVTTSASTPVGSYTLTVTGTSGKVSGSVSAGLTVNLPVVDSLTMSATPASVTMGAGSTAVYTIQIVRTGVTGKVTLSVAGLPAGAVGTFSPNPLTGSSSASTLQVTTTTGTIDGSYTVFLTASGKNSQNATLLANTSVQMVISTTSSPFTISGELTGLLFPGRTLPLDLTLMNPNKKTLSVTNLTVTVKSVLGATGSTPACTTGDYAVTQYNGPYPLVVPGLSSRSLTGLGVSSGQWPQVTLRNTNLNQDRCKGAIVTLSYSGSGQGN